MRFRSAEKIPLGKSNVSELAETPLQTELENLNVSALAEILITELDKLDVSDLETVREYVDTLIRKKKQTPEETTPEGTTPEPQRPATPPTSYDPFKQLGMQTPPPHPQRPNPQQPVGLFSLPPSTPGSAPGSAKDSAQGP